MCFRMKPTNEVSENWMLVWFGCGRTATRHQHHHHYRHHQHRNGRGNSSSSSTCAFVRCNHNCTMCLLIWRNESLGAHPQHIRLPTGAWGQQRRGCRLHCEWLANAKCNALRNEAIYHFALFIFHLLCASCASRHSRWNIVRCLRKRTRRTERELKKEKKTVTISQFTRIRTDIRLWCVHFGYFGWSPRWFGPRFVHHFVASERMGWLSHETNEPHAVFPCVHRWRRWYSSFISQNLVWFKMHSHFYCWFGIQAPSDVLSFGWLCRIR